MVASDSRVTKANALTVLCQHILHEPRLAGPSIRERGWRAPPQARLASGPSCHTQDQFIELPENQVEAEIDYLDL